MSAARLMIVSFTPCEIRSETVSVKRMLSVPIVGLHHLIGMETKCFPIACTSCTHTHTLIEIRSYKTETAFCTIHILCNLIILLMHNWNSHYANCDTDKDVYRSNAFSPLNEISSSVKFRISSS